MKQFLPDYKSIYLAQTNIDLQGQKIKFSKIQDGGETILDFEKCQYFAQMKQFSPNIKQRPLAQTNAYPQGKNASFPKCKPMAGGTSRPTMDNKNRKYEF